MICRALTWDQVIYSVPAIARGEEIFAVTGWLAEFLESFPEASPAPIPGE